MAAGHLPRLLRHTPAPSEPPCPTQAGVSRPTGALLQSTSAEKGGGGGDHQAGLIRACGCPNPVPPAGAPGTIRGGAWAHPGCGAAQPPGASSLASPSSAGGPVQDAAPSSPPTERTPLPQPLQMAARRLTQADRLGAPGQMGLAPAASFSLPFSPCFLLFFFFFFSPFT